MLDSTGKIVDSKVITYEPVSEFGHTSDDI